jgi:hypothetical protein
LFIGVTVAGRFFALHGSGVAEGDGVAVMAGLIAPHAARKRNELAVKNNNVVFLIFIL